MSKNKIRNPKKKAAPAIEGPVLSIEAGALVAEWRGLNSQIANYAAQIKQHQDMQRKSAEAIVGLEKNGLQIIGQVQTLTKILNGMGIDPKTYEPSEEEIFDEKLPDEPENGAEVVDITEDRPKTTPPNRFRRS